MARHTAGRHSSGLAGALGLTLASTVIWGIAHLRAGRRGAGLVLMGLFTALFGALVFVGVAFPVGVQDAFLKNDWLTGITVGIIVLALVWATVVIRSYQVVRPAGLGGGTRFTAGTLVVVLAMAVCTPLVWAARETYVLRDTMNVLFPGDPHHAQQINTDDPWKNKPRLNVLLLGGDGAGDRPGVRTDSMTVASIDTKTGDTVLFGLPRNLQDFPMPDRLTTRWPNGFTGYQGDEGLLNELYQDAEDHPDLMPGYPKGQRGPQLVKEVISELIGQPIDYYILVNLFGFRDIVDAMGGVNVHITKRLPIGGDDNPAHLRPPTGYLEPGYRKLNGSDALWYGRSRHADSDYARMGRQKCLLKAIADQADPKTVLARFEQIAAAAKKTISTNIPAALLPALVDLSGKAKHGADVRSLLFVPPTIDVVRPDVAKIRKLTADAITPAPKPTASHSAKKKGKADSLSAICG